MGIQTEFNPDLALRKAGTEGRKRGECIPANLREGQVYSFLKRGQRNYWLEGEIPLRTTEGNQRLSRPIAAITILYVTHHLIKGEVHTEGKYRVEEIFNPEDPKIHFEGMSRVR